MWCLGSAFSFGGDIRGDHPRLFFNAETQSAVIRRALNEEKDWYAEIKSRVDELLPVADALPGKSNWESPAGGNYDYGKEAAFAAFVYLVEQNTNVLNLAKACIERSLDYYEACYENRRSVSWYATSRTHAVMAIDWLWNDLPDADRREYLTRLIHVVNHVKNSKPFITCEHMSDYTQGMYGVIGLMWPVGVVAHGTGIEPELVREWIETGRQENQKMIEYRQSYAGDDGGGAVPTLGYMACWYPYAEWNFYYTLRSATGEDISDQLQYNTLMANYVFWNLLPSSDGLREYGYGDAKHSNGNFTSSRHHLYVHLSIIEDLFGKRYPETTALAEQIKQMLPPENRKWREEYFIYAFLQTNNIGAGAASPDISRLPMARNFEKMGEVFMRSGSRPEDVYCLFSCGGDLKHHRHYDALSFIIYSGEGFLAIDSGDRYGEMERNGPHIANYYSQSVAHNTILVHQPGEPPAGYWGGRTTAMDGGQHNVTESKLAAFETNDDYTYVAGDATGCYLHGGDLPEKVSLVARQMVFLPPNHFVIFDRVNSTGPDYPKTWLLHTVNEPQVTGNTFRADHGKSRLFCRTLLPVNANISTVGGPGKEFWTAGKNRPLPVIKGQSVNHETAGRWRVEVQPSERQLSDCFLHVLEVTGQNVETMTDVQLLQSKQSYGTELAIDGNRWRIDFNRTGPLGGKISCKGKLNFSKALSEKVQPQSGILAEHREAEVTMTYEDAVSRIPERTLPEFWITDFGEIEEHLSGLEKGKVCELTRSGGGRPIYVVTYGEPEPQGRLANFGSAVGAREPSVYCDKQARKKPVILFVGPVHGQETEGVVGLMNFLHVMEAGKDLRGHDWSELRRLGEQCRLVIIPCGNPDGLARFEPKSLQGMTLSDLRFWGQGTWADDTFCGWPRSKRQHPMKGDNCGFLGGYFNDDGINPMHDEFFNPMGPESKAVLDLARTEAPDLAVSLHSYDIPPGFLCPMYVPVEVKQKAQELSVRYSENLKAYGLPSKDFSFKEEKGAVPPSFNLVSALYHVSGANAVVFESPHGLVGKGLVPFSFDDLLDIQLLLYQAMLESSLE